MKNIVERDVLISYPNFRENFIIHTDANKTHLGGVIIQNGKPIAFNSRKLTRAQINYTTTEKELLSIVETIKYFCKMFLGHRIIVYGDHNNLIFENFTIERGIRWRLLLEKYGPEIKYIKGPDKNTAYALSRLP